MFEQFFMQYFRFVDLLASENIPGNSEEELLGYIPVKHTSQYIKDKFKKEIQPSYDSLNKNINKLFGSQIDKLHNYFDLPKKNFAFKIIPDINDMLSKIQLEINQNDYLR